MTAKEAGAKVLMLEIAPKDSRGGDSRHTRNLRYVHLGGNSHMVDSYPEEELWDDLMRVTEGHTNEELARLTVRESGNAGYWMIDHGCMFQPAMRFNSDTISTRIWI